MNTAVVRKTGKNQNPADNYPFSLFDQDFLDLFKRGIPLKCRVYIYRCLNLSAQSTHIDYYHRLAGMTALCTASPYPELVIGNGESSDDVKTVKRLCDNDKWIKD